MPDGRSVTDADAPERPPPLANVQPMLAKPGSLPREPERYACELKWDGVRTLAHIWDGRVRLRSRNGIDVTTTYPELAGLANAVGEAVLDGEIVAFDDKGNPSFQRLQDRMGTAEPDLMRIARTPVAFVAFDVLYLDGEDLMELPYEDRRARLDGLGLAGAGWITSPSFGPPSAHIFDAVKERGMEGLILKRLDSRYHPGKRSDAWTKVKMTRRQELVVGGWYPGEGARSSTFGSLLLGVHDESGALRYAGSVGTGFTDAFLAETRRTLDSMRQADSPFAGPVDKPGAVFVEPRLVAEVEFTEWTKEGHLRHPSFQGFRHDKDPRTVVREESGE